APRPGARPPRRGDPQQPRPRARHPRRALIQPNDAQLRAVRSWRQRTAQLAEHFPAEERLRVMSALPATSDTHAQLVAMGF
ncbi:MAG: hypothetical protein WB761_20230, partial [Solirubrobacteraceae bacterium]